METSESLHKVLRKGFKWEWGQKQMIAFKKAKSLIHETNILVHYDPNKLYQLACNASLYGLGAVLLQIMPYGTEKPVSYASRTISKTERNYSRTEKEAFTTIYQGLF